MFIKYRIGLALAMAVLSAPLVLAEPVPAAGEMPAFESFDSQTYALEMVAVNQDVIAYIDGSGGEFAKLAKTANNGKWLFGVHLVMACANGMAELPCPNRSDGWHDRQKVTSSKSGRLKIYMVAGGLPIGLSNTA